MYFQASDYKGRNFLDLHNDNSNPIYLAYSKDRAQLKYFGFSNLLYAYITRLITNYTLIGEYRQSFFPNTLVICLYSNSPIETRVYILYNCKQYKT